MNIDRRQVALNALQWTTLNHDPGPGEYIVSYQDPAWIFEQSEVHRQLRTSGFDAVMMEVLPNQTLQSYQRMIDDHGLRLAPGYLQVPIAEDHGIELRRGSADWVRWFDPVRRRAEETNFFGLSTLFVAAEVFFDSPRVAKAAVGAAFDQSRLDQQVEYLVEAGEILKSEGVQAGLHNHVGTWIETEYEIDYALEQIDPEVMGASLDIGHLEWAGIDAAPFLTRHRDRLVDIHIKDIDRHVADESRRRPTRYAVTEDRRLYLEPGLGDVDLDSVLSALGDDFAGWIVIEVDQPSMDPLASAKTSWAWVDKVFRS